MKAQYERIIKDLNKLSFATIEEYGNFKVAKERLSNIFSKMFKEGYLCRTVVNVVVFGKKTWRYSYEVKTNFKNI